MAAGHTHSLFVLNGPNLNLLGKREPEIYGRATLADIEAATRARAQTLGLTVDFRQSNSEGTLIDWVQEATAKANGLIVNLGGLTHTSVALRDAVLGSGLPVVEVHLSNLAKREPFRHHSYVTDVALGIIAGFGAAGYELAVEALARHLSMQTD